MSVSSDKEGSTTHLLAEVLIAASYQTIENPNAIDKLCIPCIGSKSTGMVRYNKSMTISTNKQKEVHADLWDPHNPPPESRSTYAAILICEYTRKT